MRRALLCIATAAVMPDAAVAQNQAGEVIGSAISLIGGAILAGKAQRDVAAMSGPLLYESELPQLDPANPSDPRNFDVAGVRLRMTAEEAMRRLRASRYAIAETVDAPTFAARVRDALPKPVGGYAVQKVPLEVVATGPNDQKIVVTMIVLPDGPVVQEVRYRMDNDTMTNEAFAAQAVRKYGEPTTGETEMAWCVAADCTGAWLRRPHLLVRPDMKTVDLVDVDEARDAALAARMQAEIDARKPRAQDAQF